MDTTRIVIVGGGYGGVRAAKQLCKHLKRRREVQITLIDKKPYHTLMTQLHEVAGGRIEPSSVKVSYKKIFGARDIEIVVDTVTSVDFEAKKVFGNRTYPYDYLVLGTGVEPADFGIPGIAEHASTLWSLHDALAIRERTEEVFIEAAEEPDPERRRKMLTFAVAGAGFTGVEMAGELIDRKRSLCRQYDIDEEEVKIYVVEALGEVLPMFSGRQQKKAERFLRKKNVEILLNSLITEVRERSFSIKAGRNHEPRDIECGTLIWTCGIAGTQFAANLDIEQGHVKRPRANRYMQSPSHENVYLVGDMIWFMENEKALPQIVEAAVQTADVAAENIVTQITGKGELEEFTSNFHGHMVSIGAKYGLSNNKGVKMDGVFAQALKHLVNVHYLFTLAGLNEVWGYLKSQFIDNTEGRSIFGGLFAAKIPIYWVVPLRLFLGGKWLYEGVSKVFDGWLSPENIYIVQTDAVSAATEAAAAAEDASWQIEPLIEEPLGIYTWLSETFVEAAPFLFQSGVVVAEIAIGLAFIGGLFTFPAAIASLALCIMLTIGSMAGSEILWYMAAAIVMLGGAGRGLGLDYWAMPWLKRWWNRRWIAKRTYLYTDEPE